MNRLAQDRVEEKGTHRLPRRETVDQAANRMTTLAEGLPYAGA